MPTDRERKFYAEYAVDQNGTQAAIRAGYSPQSAHVTASRLLKKAKEQPEREAELAKTMRDVVKRVEAQIEVAKDSAAYVLTKAIEMVDYGTEYVPVLGMFGPVKVDGEYIYEMRDPKVATSNLALLAKRHPEFRDNAPDRPNQTLVLNGLTDAQLDEAIRSLSGRA